MANKGNILVGTVGQGVMLSADEGESWTRASVRSGMHSDCIVRALREDARGRWGGRHVRRRFRRRHRLSLQCGIDRPHHVRCRLLIVLSELARRLHVGEPQPLEVVHHAW